jgi:hypothetical protein
MNILEPEIKNKTYTFAESVNGGYTQRSSYLSHRIVSVWNKQLELLEFTIDDVDMLPIFNKDGKPIKKNEVSNNYELDYQYHRAICARNRHLKSLKIYLGLEKKEEIKTGIFIWRPSRDWKIEIGKLDLNKDGTPKFAVHNMLYTKATEDKVKLAEEYNVLLRDFEKERDRLKKLIFDGDKT